MEGPDSENILRGLQTIIRYFSGSLSNIMKFNTEPFRNPLTHCKMQPGLVDKNVVRTFICNGFKTLECHLKIDRFFRSENIDIGRFNPDQISKPYIKIIRKVIIKKPAFLNSYSIEKFYESKIRPFGH